MSIALLDAGPLAALFKPSDRHHQRYTRTLASSDAPLRLYTTWPCVAEASHLIGATADRAMLQWIGQGGVQVFPFDPADLLRMIDWMRTYTEVPRTNMDFADASLYWLAVETGVVRVLTVDRRDFSRYRLPDGRHFEIL